MNVLDENIPEAQRQLLRSWRIRVSQIGQDIGHQGMQDLNQVIPLLHSLRRPVLFTRDLGLFDRRLCHHNYAIVCLAVSAQEAASFIRRFLRQKSLNATAKRIGKVFRVSEVGIRYWQLLAEEPVEIEWD